MSRTRTRAKPRAIAEDPLDLPEHYHALAWLTCACFAALGLAIAADLGLLRTLFGLDRSRVTWLVAALVAAGSLHVLWHTLACSTRVEAARAALHDARSRALVTDADAGPGARTAAGPATGSGPPARRFVAAWLEESGAGRPAAERDDELLDIWADRLRAPVDTGWFLVDTTVRLGLLGTIVGFILIFTSLGSISIEGPDGLRALLVAMSDGMGTALFTTLAGLVGATLLAVQCLVLGRATEHLLGLLARCRHAAVPGLHRD